MKGRKPIPDEIKKATGNAGGRPLDKEKLQLAPEMPDKPDWLNNEGRKEWDRITKELFDLGLLQRVDRAGLTMYCRYWQRYVTAEKHLNTAHGYFDTTPNNFRVQSTYLNISNKAAEMCMKLMNDFGMNPTSRQRLTIRKHGGEQGDFFDDWIKQDGDNNHTNKPELYQA